METPKVTVSKEAVPRRTDAAPIPTSLGESSLGGGVTFSPARQEAIRMKLPRKYPYGPAINARLRDLDDKLVRFQYSTNELDLIETVITAAAADWENEMARRAQYARYVR